VYNYARVITTSVQLIWLRLSRRLRTIQHELAYVRQAAFCLYTVSRLRTKFGE
jgi:hypothetical protein